MIGINLLASEFFEFVLHKTQIGEKARQKIVEAFNRNKMIDSLIDAYKQILKENGGKKPRNMGLQIQELIGPKMSELASEYKENISQAIQKTQQPIPMIAPDGRKVMIPPNRIEDALNSGAKFQ